MLIFFFLVALCMSAFMMFTIVDKQRSFPVIAILLSILSSVMYWYQVPLWGYVLLILMFDLYLLFYVEDPTDLKNYCFIQLFLYLILCGVCYVIPEVYLAMPMYFLTGTYVLIFYLQERKTSFTILGLCLLLLLATYLIHFQEGLLSYGIMMISIVMIEMIYRSFADNFQRSSADFQNQVMSHHYEEVKAVYLNMRGWRHDYHNHIQTMKAYGALAQWKELYAYLNELEHDLQKVDQLVKTGNVLVDAILNSKLSLAQEKQIPLTYKALVPSTISIRDVDLCVMIGNLMDNAIESCEKLPVEQRFIRIYMDIVRKQFYVSIMNAAVEDLDFNARNYISSKRGNHGHGMKRVKLTINKYEGVLNLKNEPGVFVSEIMIPLDEY